MPDWSYRTVLRPLLFALPGEAARRYAVTALGLLGRLPGGCGLIDFMGHMRPDAALARTLDVPGALGPVGLGALIDPGAVAYAALSRFGVGFVEVGPVVSTAAAPGSWQRDRVNQSLRAAVEQTVLVAELVAALQSSPKDRAPLWVRVGPREPGVAAIVEATAPWASAYLLQAADDEQPEELSARVAQLASLLAVDGRGRPAFLSVRLDQPNLLELARAASDSGAQGIWVRGEQRASDGSRTYAPRQEAVLSAVRALRASLPAACVLIAGGIYEPEDARRLLAAGARLVAVEAGLVYAGPGLVKRCNDALLRSRSSMTPERDEPLTLASAQRAWFWGWLLGLAMLLGGALALAIASTRVVLPYDEALCGLTRQQLISINPRLLPFMAHDRVTLAGSMLSLGVLYSALARHGLRHGAHWSHLTVLISAFTGFCSMFLFLGFGYFDPFHAFVTAVLFQLLLLCVFAPLGDSSPREAPEWRESAAFLRAQWGQLIFVLLGCGFLLAGLYIAGIGISSVFVQEDLDFMRTTAARLGAAHERLLALVAHDRATLGGMLMANGWVILLSALWGFRAGAAWLWQALAVAGNVGFVLAIGVHYIVGYQSLLHLAPAFLGWALWLLALGLCRGWLVAPVGELRNVVHV